MRRSAVVKLTARVGNFSPSGKSRKARCDARAGSRCHSVGACRPRRCGRRRWLRPAATSAATGSAYVLRVDRPPGARPSRRFGSGTGAGSSRPNRGGVTISSVRDTVTGPSREATASRAGIIAEGRPGAGGAGDRRRWASTACCIFSAAGRAAARLGGLRFPRANHQRAGLRRRFRQRRQAHRFRIAELDAAEARDFERFVAGPSQQDLPGLFLR